MPETYLLPAQVAERFRVHVQTVRLWADAGELPYTRTPGGHRRYLLSDVEAFAARAAAKRGEPAA